MLSTRPVFRAPFCPVDWALPQPGTNGYVSSWGELQAGSPPPRAAL
ncbi:hypothetical protein NBM05_06470 [Rothia sp. AR01]|uniref:Uncharacterized protein n=1 Tax=Rothia santali TaxID=2949643 RepID=A0A9X2KI58_9MICC|nr:hypothetical protein [Rothia santali]MCP3425665.1 hypothetical protein [Rothia santali]